MKHKDHYNDEYIQELFQKIYEAIISLNEKAFFSKPCKMKR